MSPVPVPGAMVRLVPMESSDFGPFLEALVHGYAEDHVRDGQWSPEESLARSRAETGQLLPQGLQTPGHLFFSIVAGAPEEKVGVLWLAIQPRGGFVYDLEIFEPFRRRGYAEEAMRRAERELLDRNVHRIALHVFGPNQGARRLYAKLGYEETNVLMAKRLDG